MNPALQDDMQKEIELFFARYYRQEKQLVEYWEGFAQTHDLEFPKKDHLRYLDLLLEAYMYLRNMVTLFAPPLLRKLESDITELNQALSHILTDPTENSILYKKFQKESKILNAFKKESNFSHYYEDLNTIFANHFELYEYQFKVKITKELKEILNQKAALFEYILWDEANKCQRIKNSILFRHIKTLNTRNYIEYMLEILTPYSNNHITMKKLLGELS